VNYTYDGDGDRVEKSNGTLYWYGAGSQVLLETGLSGSLTSEYVYFGGKRVARRDASNDIYYYTEDMLGSSRAITTSTGTVCYNADFYPYGGEQALINTCPQNYKFEGKERDAETTNDDFGARFYSSTYGRFLSADWSAIPEPVPYANLTNPQTLNLYAMVSDNPETFADLDGHVWLPCQDAPPAAPQAQNATSPQSTTPPPPQEASAAAPALIGCLASGVCGDAAAAGGPAAILFALPLAAMAFAVVTPPMEQGDPMTPGYMPAPPVTSTPASTSQQGAVDTSPIQTSRGSNVAPDPNAQGPHSVAKRDPATGKVTGYTTYDASGKPTSRYRATGKPHGKVNPPLVLEPKPGKGPGGSLEKARPARPEEIPH
jgi:RHS repeat-associated protein